MTKVNRLLLMSFAFAIIALFFSFLSQFFWKIEPCRLCLYQRVPLFAIIPLSIFGLCNEIKLLPILLIRLAFCTLAILGGYHLLIQLHMIADPCAVPQSIKSLQDFKDILSQSHIPCAINAFSILGVPVSGYNLAFAILFALILPWQINDQKTNKKEKQ